MNWPAHTIREQSRAFALAAIILLTATGVGFAIAGAM